MSEYSTLSQAEIAIAKLRDDLRREKRKPTGQNSGRSLIDCINFVLTSLELNDSKVESTIATGYRSFKFTVFVDGVELFEVSKGRNIEMCYEAFIEFVIHKAIGLNPESKVECEW